MIDLPSLETVVLSNEAFHESVITIFESIFYSFVLIVDLPSLKSISLGYSSFMGIYNDTSSSLTMRSIYCVLYSFRSS